MRKIADAYVAAYFERHPDEATLDGVAGVRHDQLPDNSPITRGRWQAREDRWLAELQRMDPTPLVGRPEWTAYGVMRASLEGSVATGVWRYEIWNVSHVHRGWLPIVTSLAAVQPVGTEELRAQALARWRGIPLYIASEMANQREGLRLGYSAPQGNVRLVIKQLDQLLDQRLDRSPLYAPALRDSTPAFREEMLVVAQTALERAQAAMPRWFGILPRAGIVIRPYPEFREQESVAEWVPPAEDGSRPGTYLLSTYDPKHKARADLEPLTFHETIPGHHLQGTIALERGAAIPAIARYFWSPGFGEGWAEYAEQLADEMGLYSSDTTRLGALADLTLSAALLVVDTGINAFGWTRDDGIQFLEAHTRVPETRAAVPVDRYPVWPAQGLSYALGRLEIRRLRSLAEQAFGSKFDIKAFHDRLLQDGAIPLPMLREQIEGWLGAPR